MSHTTLRWHHWQSANNTAQPRGSQLHHHHCLHQQQQLLVQRQQWQQPAVTVLMQSSLLHRASKMLPLLVMPRMLTTAVKALNSNRLVLAAASASI
jgi:hypothetical protein